MHSARSPSELYTIPHNEINQMGKCSEVIRLDSPTDPLERDAANYAGQNVAGRHHSLSWSPLERGMLLRSVVRDAASLPCKPRFLKRPLHLRHPIRFAMLSAST